MVEAASVVAGEAEAAAAIGAVPSVAPVVEAASAVLVKAIATLVEAVSVVLVEEANVLVEVSVVTLEELVVLVEEVANIEVATASLPPPTLVAVRGTCVHLLPPIVVILKPDGRALVDMLENNRKK